MWRVVVAVLRICLRTIPGWIIGAIPGWLSTSPDEMAANWPKYLAWLSKVAGMIPPEIVAAITSPAGTVACIGVGVLVAIGLNVPPHYLPWRQSRLKLFVGEGDPYVRVGVREGDPDLIYSIAIEATPGSPIAGIKVVVDACEPPGLFALSTAMQVMHGGFDPDLTFRLAGGEKKHPQLLEVRTKRRKTPQVLPSHIYRVADRVVKPDTYIVTVKATSEEPAESCSQRFQIVVQNDLKKPVRITPI